MKIFISEKQIVEIREFMENYLGKSYDGKRKLTHEEMFEYLIQKNGIIPEKMKFTKVRKEDFLKGNIVAVKDETSKILIYRNPRINLNTLFYELHSKENLIKLKKVRNEIMKNIVSKQEDVDLKYNIEKYNRQKKLENKNPKRMKMIYR